ncbi:MAG: hypothetical protein K0R12_1249 [Gammaproteobacteria bacterium]|nr:hypothetical protein [Gammaproteobacteria bacterium]
MCCWLTTLSAKDLGVNGVLWPIEEINLKEAIASDASKVNWDKFNDQLKTQASQWGSHLKPLPLPIAEENKTQYVDPSITLSQGIWIDKEHYFPAGFSVNPLRWVKPVTAMLFFNGHSEEQVNFAKKAIQAVPGRLLLVMTEGDPQMLGKEWHQPIYYANPNLINRFHIKATPSLLNIGVNEHRYQLVVSTFGLPYEASVLKKCWNGCPLPFSEKKNHAIEAKTQK